MSLPEYFLQHSREWRVVAHVVAPIIWFQTTLLITGIWTDYGRAQGGRPLESTPFFSGDVAAERLGSIVAAGQVKAALLFYGLDLVNAILIGAGLAALIGFGLRALRWQSPLARMALSAPLALVFTEFLENGLLASALVFPALLEAGGAAAGIATGAKFLCFGLSSLLGLAGAIAGVGAWARGLFQRPQS